MRSHKDFGESDSPGFPEMRDAQNLYHKTCFRRGGTAITLPPEFFGFRPLTADNSLCTLLSS
jgi:hypothetical protein